MKCTLVGSRYFGALVFDALLNDGVEFAGVVAPSADDRLAIAARAAGVSLHLLTNPKVIPGEAIPDETGLIVAAHTHARVSDAALARSRLGGIGYHPSLLPRHRGIAAVEWTILEGDAIAGGSVYHLADGWDAGAIAAQDWCFVARGETARDLWERALAPIGLELLTRVVREAARTGKLPAHPQDERFATRAPMIQRTVSLTDQQPSVMTSIVVTAIGTDRPGIVSLLSDRAARHGANWSASRMANHAGQFAGTVQLEVAEENAEPLANALRGLDSAGLRTVVARSVATPVVAGCRSVRLDLIGPDRPAIVRDLSGSLARHGVSIESLETEIVLGDKPGERLFKAQALLVVPNALPNETLRGELGTLASRMMVDIALGDESSAAASA